MNDWHSAEAVLEYAVSRGLVPGDAPLEAEALSGGVSGEVWKVSGPQGACVLKRALAKLKVEADWFSDVRRVEREQEAMALLSPLLPVGRIPRVLDYDADGYAFAMSCAPEGSESWKDRLMQGQFDADIAGRVGLLLRTMHEASRGIGEAEKARMADLTFFRELRIEPFYAAVAIRYPELSGRICALADELTEETPDVRKCVVHGDFSPKNILIDPDGAPVLLDFEVCHWGNPVYDLAFCIGHLVLKGLHLGREADAYALVEAFCAAYGEAPSRLLPHLGLMLMARVDGKSPVSYIRNEQTKERIRSLAYPLIREELSGEPLAAIAAMLQGGHKK